MGSGANDVEHKQADGLLARRLVLAVYSQGY